MAALLTEDMIYDGLRDRLARRYISTKVGADRSGTIQGTLVMTGNDVTQRVNHGINGEIFVQCPMTILLLSFF